MWRRGSANVVSGCLVRCVCFSRECGRTSTSNRGFLVKGIRLGAAAVLIIGLTGFAGLIVPAHAVQPSDTGKRDAVAELVIQSLEASLAADPKGFEVICWVYGRSPVAAIFGFMMQKDIKDGIRQLGASKEDARAGIKIALKKACYGYKKAGGTG